MFYSYKMHTCLIVTKRAHVMEKKNVRAFWRRKTHTLYGQAKRARHVMENHKQWVLCMSREMSKHNSLHHQDLEPIVIF